PRIRPPLTVAFDRRMDGVEQLLIVERLGEKLHGTSLHRANGHGDIAVAGDEHDWQVHVRARQRSLKLEPALPGQSDIEYEAAWHVRPCAFQKLLRRLEHARFEPNRLQQICERTANRGVIVDDEDNGLVLRRTHWEATSS